MVVVVVVFVVVMMETWVSMTAVELKAIVRGEACGKILECARLCISLSEAFLSWLIRNYGLRV
jgi:hypothetical protein